MHNEILLIGSLILLFGGVLLFYYLFGTTGLYCWTVFATIAANIEVLILWHGTDAGKCNVCQYFPGNGYSQ